MIMSPSFLLVELTSLLPNKKNIPVPAALHHFSLLTAENVNQFKIP
jgi:hypothetical protein